MVSSKTATVPSLGLVTVFNAVGCCVKHSLSLYHQPEWLAERIIGSANYA